VEETTAKVAETATTAATTVAETANSMWAALGELFKRKLPNGIELNIPKLGVENKVLDFIASAAPVDKTTWFDFDRLLFDTGKATLQPASQEQLENFANILKAYPETSIKLGGYTDNTGAKAANMKLSQERANSVMAELVKMGIAPARLEAEGYGDGNPVADNATEEGRAKNRRISMRFTKK
jgi:K(+)-stimulated pyrophosphate-energized sodium pump